MGTFYGHFDKGATTPVYQAADFDRFIDLLFDSGVVPNYFNQLVVAVTGAGLSVTVATGGAVVNGGYYVNDAPITLSVDAEGAGTNRYDRIIIRKTVATKIIEAVVLKGASAASPTIPALTQTSAIWEIALKTVYIASGAVTLIAGNLTDTPIYADVFGGQLAAIMNPKMCKVYKSASQSIANITNTILTFDSEIWDTDTMHDNVINNSRITIKTAGVYNIIGMVEFAANTTGIRSIGLSVNSNVNIAATQVSTCSTSITSVQVIMDYRLNVGGYVELFVYQSSGGSLAVDYTANITNLSVRRVCD